MKTETKALIILIPGFAADANDSTCLPAQQSFLTALKLSFPVTRIIVIAFHYPYFRRFYQWKGIDVISMNGRNARWPLRIWLERRIMKTLKKINSENDVMGLLSFWCGQCAWLGKRFSKKYNIPHYCWIWGQDARKGNKYVKRIRPSGNELIALSDFLQEEFERNYQIRPAHVILPGIDPLQFHNTNKKRDIDVLGVGSLIPLKRYDLFITMIHELKKDLPGIRAVLCGKGPEDGALQKQIASLQLQDNVVLTGEVQYAEVLQLMQRSKILLHPSSYEGFSGVCMEALYAGAHVISFCRAMNQEIDQWHLVNSEKEMLAQAKSILMDPTIEHKSISVPGLRPAEQMIMELFQSKNPVLK